jgi:hypothetical protein
MLVPEGGPCGRCGQSVDVREHERHEGRPFHPICLARSRSEQQHDAPGAVRRPARRSSQRRSTNAVLISVLPAPSERARPRRPPLPSAPDSADCCAECGAELEDETVLDQGRAYHRACLCCCACRQPLTAGTGFFERSNLRYCRECFQETLFRCHGCLQPLVAAGQGVQRGPHLFHPACLPPDKPLPAASVSPAGSPPPSPPPNRPPRWSMGDEYDNDNDTDTGELDNLMDDFLNVDILPAPLPHLLVRTSRESFARGSSILLDDDHQLSDLINELNEM